MLRTNNYTDTFSFLELHEILSSISTINKTFLALSKTALLQRTKETVFEAYIQPAVRKMPNLKHLILKLDEFNNSDDAISELSNLHHLKIIEFKYNCTAKMDIIMNRIGENVYYKLDKIILPEVELTLLYGKIKRVPNSIRNALRFLAKKKLHGYLLDESESESENGNQILKYFNEPKLEFKIGFRSFLNYFRRNYKQHFYLVENIKKVDFWYYSSYNWAYNLPIFECLKNAKTLEIKRVDVLEFTKISSCDQNTQLKKIVIRLQLQETQIHESFLLLKNYIDTKVHLMFLDVYLYMISWKSIEKLLLLIIEHSIYHPSLKSINGVPVKSMLLNNESPLELKIFKPNKKAKFTYAIYRLFYDKLFNVTCFRLWSKPKTNKSYSKLALKAAICKSEIKISPLFKFIIDAESDGLTGYDAFYLFTQIINRAIDFGLDIKNCQQDYIELNSIRKDLKIKLLEAIS